MLDHMQRNHPESIYGRVISIICDSYKHGIKFRLHEKIKSARQCMISNNNDHKCCEEETKEVFFSFGFIVDFALWKFMKLDAHTIEHLMLTARHDLINRTGHKDDRFKEKRAKPCLY